MKKQIYELSYWLKNEVEENKILKDLLEKFGFELIHENPPKVRNLAYPINKERTAKFGTFYFYATSDKIEEFKNKLRNLNEILRFIILKRKHLKLNNK